ncbi:MAG: hypothetical protein MZV70_40470 [Desulfobacterales bacterium]|nr:hypothetical protein [Desulfobacterales bacterium]
MSAGQFPGMSHQSFKHNEEEKMKKLLIGFLAVGLIMGFAMTASAQPNIKASGQLYMYGAYTDNMSLDRQWRPAAQTSRTA